jgi:capsular polysaccharide biosynthesis protein
MVQHKRFALMIIAVLMMALMLPMNLAAGAPIYQSATPTPAPEEEADEEEMEEEEMEPVLTTARVHADLVRPGRVLMSARSRSTTGP